MRKAEREMESISDTTSQVSMEERTDALIITLFSLTLREKQLRVFTGFGRSAMLLATECLELQSAMSAAIISIQSMITVRGLSPSRSCHEKLASVLTT